MCAPLTVSLWLSIGIAGTFKVDLCANRAYKHIWSEQGNFSLRSEKKMSDGAYDQQHATGSCKPNLELFKQLLRSSSRKDQDGVL